MDILPAIDLRGGRCVRLVEGDFNRETVFADAPAETARRWEREGARWLHVVDLDGAREGSPQNREAIARILDSVLIPVEVGGGIRTPETARLLLEMGVCRVIIGTSAALDSGLAQAFFEAFGERVVLGLDARDGFVAVRGWKEILPKPAAEMAVEMAALGARRIIYTDIRRDGQLQGVNVEGVRAMAESVRLPVIASGGVSTLEDIRSLLPLEPLGVEGIIIGKALYTGDVSLKEVLALTGEGGVK
ncbi:MAG: 1-(5-phosphoribosyl)-5-[(5-phosphoribosylamino)methylideneamino]imidazole-4-carboxamide isomerase [Armatimonadetes bacterium]|nr:1-(5-phosphoribosyl)-5-[(5-phosphoribosylamino)methylideneamino]imidazole-4-carboxamide isomerase [Armatimonadota bacterium]